VTPPEGVRDVGTGPNTGANVLDLSQVANDFQFQPAADSRPYHLILDMNYELDSGIVLSSTTGFSKDDRFEIITDDNNFPFFAFIRTKKQEELDQLSQELRLTSPAGRSIEWMAGLFYQREELDTLGDQHSSQVNGRIFNHINQTQAVQDSDWLSVFGTVSFNFMDDKLSLDLGLRATQVEKGNRAFGNQAFWLTADGSVADEQNEVAVARTPIEPNGVEVAESIENNETNAQVVLRWRPTGQLSFYAKYADAFKAGGFDLGIARITPNRAEAFSFGPEQADTIEVGMKGIFLDGRAALDVSVFTETFEGLQVSGFSDVVGRQIVSNAAEQKVEGVEFSGQLQINEQLRFNLTGSLLDGKVVSFPGAQCAGQEFDLGLCTGPGGTIDRSGFDALRTPDWEFSTGADFSVPVFDRFQFRVIGNFNFKDDFETVYRGGEIDIGKTERINLSLGFGDIDGVWEVSAWVRNLTEPLPKYDAAEDLIPDGSVIEPLSESQFKTYGVRLQYNF
jgi:iron complex outermembrane receptor protein